MGLFSCLCFYSDTYRQVILLQSTSGVMEIVTLLIKSSAAQIQTCNKYCEIILGFSFKKMAHYMFTSGLLRYRLSAANNRTAY